MIWNDLHNQSLVPICQVHIVFYLSNRFKDTSHYKEWKSPSLLQCCRVQRNGDDCYPQLMPTIDILWFLQKLGWWLGIVEHGHTCEYESTRCETICSRTYVVFPQISDV